MSRTLLLPWLLLALAGSAAAQPLCSARSDALLLPVVELYTSEGCSSCPPADRWLSSLREGGAGGREVLPLAFHVDYWDYIGWTDRFAQPAFAERQRRMAARNGTRTIYTPQVLFNARDFHAWRDPAAFGNAVAAARRLPPGADLELRLAKETAGWLVTLRGQLKPGVKPAHGEAWLAVLESGLENEVRAGENTGRRLRHDYVVRRWLGPYRFGPRGELEVREDIVPRWDWNPRQLALAAVARSSGGDTLQSLLLPWCPGG